MASVTSKLVTAEEFFRMPPPAASAKLELIRGQIVVLRRQGFRHGLRQARVGGLLDQFGRSTHHGRAVVATGIVTERAPDTVRGPDVSYWSAARLPLDLQPEGYPEAPPDLCVEVLSPSNQVARVLEKLREYFKCGVRMVWVVDPEERTVTVYCSPDEGRVFHESATFIGDDVLPGFSCQVAELFA